jgi:hypothetical protein
MMGDINNDGTINLTDTIMGLQTMSGIVPAQNVYMGCDVDQDGKIGLAEVIYMMQVIAALR